VGDPVGGYPKSKDYRLILAVATFFPPLIENSNGESEGDKGDDDE
ncbi:hypothetical protein C5167_039223, partial [Papaver somniferum]